MRKRQVALYWGAACGGCDVAVLDTDTYVLELAGAADLRFWPIGLDAKYADVERMADGELDLALYSGGVRNAENEHVAHLLRKKSRALVAFGACAHLGGTPGLANLSAREDIVERTFLKGPTIEPGNQTVPRERTHVNGHTLGLPRFYRRVYPLGDVVAVDYVVPGCPPAAAQVRGVLEAFVAGTLPPPFAVVGASERAQCDECPRTKEDKRVTRFYRPYEVVADPSRCLLEQGLLCAGPATRAGCGHRCQSSNMPCRGCYGPPPHVADQGAKLVSAIASVVDATTPEAIDRALDTLPDIAGYACRYSLPASRLARSLRP
jgi:F420-non-reducing hydrogenase small subunit